MKRLCLSELPVTDINRPQLVRVRKMESAQNFMFPKAEALDMPGSSIEIKQNSDRSQRCGLS